MKALIISMFAIIIAVGFLSYRVGHLHGQQQQAIVTEKAMEQVDKWSKLATECAAQRLMDGMNLPPNKK